MEQIPTKPTGLLDRGLLSGRYGLEQPEAPECRDESLDHLGRRSRADLLSGPLADFSERGGAVELARRRHLARRNLRADPTEGRRDSDARGGRGIRRDTRAPRVARDRSGRTGGLCPRVPSASWGSVPSEAPRLRSRSLAGAPRRQGPALLHAVLRRRLFARDPGNAGHTDRAPGR